MKYSLETDPRLHSQFVFTITVQAVQWGKGKSFQPMVVNNSMDRINSDATSYHTPKLIMGYTPKWKSQNYKGSRSMHRRISLQA